MPKAPLNKHVKFESIDNCVADSPESNVQDGQQGGAGQCHGTSSTRGGCSSRLPNEEIEIHIEDENGVRQPYHQHDQITEHCSGCHMLGQPHKHQRVTTADQPDDDDDDDDGCRYSPQQGPHIILLTIICIPFVFLTALVVTCYLGVLTWYNIFLYYYDERGWIHRIVVCPLLILSFPPIILTTALGISLYSSVQQLSWYLTSWRTSVTDLEKGFYAWLCLHLGLQDCSPYEVITLEDDDEDGLGRTISHAVSPV
ncbi:transmembrane protein 169-like [Patiria miniata]|uniref:Transmembrane protein 169 n=1 Tax=Patiria miniata TaxID=46514 RepID=A0A914BSM1_PATMI|nr:transmembrane protein 169-like [Patiria miniata]